MRLEKAEEKRKEFKSNINEIIVGSKKSKDQIRTLKILEHFTNHEKKLLSHLMIIISLYLKLNKAKRREGLKILTPKQILQRLPVSLAQLKAGNISENLLNEIRQIIYSLYQNKEITKKVYNNIMN